MYKKALITFLLATTLLYAIGTSTHIYQKAWSVKYSKWLKVKIVIDKGEIHVYTKKIKGDIVGLMEIEVVNNNTRLTIKGEDDTSK